MENQITEKRQKLKIFSFSLFKAETLFQICRPIQNFVLFDSTKYTYLSISEDLRSLFFRFPQVHLSIYLSTSTTLLFIARSSSTIEHSNSRWGFQLNVWLNYIYQYIWYKVLVFVIAGVT